MRKSTLAATLVGLLLLGIGVREASAVVVIRVGQICIGLGSGEACNGKCKTPERYLPTNAIVRIGDQEFQEGILNISDVARNIGAVQVIDEKGSTLFAQRVNLKEIAIVDTEKGTQTPLAELLR